MLLGQASRENGPSATEIRFWRGGKGRTSGEQLSVRRLQELCDACADLWEGLAHDRQAVSQRQAKYVINFAKKQGQTPSACLVWRRGATCLTSCGYLSGPPGGDKGAPTRFVLTRGEVQHNLRADGIPQPRSPTGWQNRERRREVPKEIRQGRLRGGPLSSTYFNPSL